MNHILDSPTDPAKRPYRLWEYISATATIVILYNGIMWWWAVPHWQRLANGHTSDDIEWGVLLVVILVSLGLSVWQVARKRGWYVLFLLIACSTIYWLTVFGEIECISCSQGG